MYLAPVYYLTMFFSVVVASENGRQRTEAGVALFHRRQEARALGVLVPCVHVDYASTLPVALDIGFRIAQKHLEVLRRRVRDD